MTERLFQTMGPVGVPRPTESSRLETDTLSDVLRTVHLTGAVFFAVEASSPWVAEAPSSSVVGPHIMPGVDHVIEYHVLVSGSCWGGLLGEPPVRLEAGDILVFPQGDAHVLSSAPGMRSPPDIPLHVGTPGRRLPVLLSLEGGGEARTEVVCGFLGCDVHPFNPLLACLPRVLHVPGFDGDPTARRAFLDLALRESSSPTPGGDCVLARLSELMFVDAVRRHLGALPSSEVGWLAGLRDELVAKALRALHDRPAEPWTLETLAHEVGASRATLADRFVTFVQIPPMQYLARWRMQLAASLLSRSNATLAEVADRVGYGSEAALSRAFKRWVGMAPAHYRQAKASGAAPAG